MLVIALVLVLVVAGAAVLVAEAARSVVPLVGPDAQIFTHAATPTEHATLPAEKPQVVRVNV